MSSLEPTKPDDDIAATRELAECPVPPAPGDAPTVPGYDLLEPVGVGGMGVVYKARQANLNRFVALKTIHTRVRVQPGEVVRFLAEAEAVAAVRHPHVVQVYEYGEADGRPFLAMEYLPGGSLSARLTAGPLAPAAAAALVGKVARGVQAAHDRQIVHRDLKPGNILFDEHGEPKVTDFGLAKRGAGGDLTQTTVVMGTPAYMAPEQASGKSKFAGPQADVWALGVVLYECLTGQQPFGGLTVDSLLYGVMATDPPPFRRVARDVPRDLELITRKCLAKDPADRYPAAGELADDLGRFLAGEPVRVRAAGLIERTAKWMRRKPTLAAAYALTGVTVLLAGGIAGAVWLWQRAERDRADAVAARAVAEDARDALDREREKLAAFEYGRTMQIAYQEWREGHVARPRGLIADTTPGLRGWEWRYVHRLCHADRVTLAGHAAPVMAAAFRPDGGRVATASLDGTARVWDAATGAELRTLKGHEGFVYAVGFDPTGARVVTAGFDGTARVWDAATGDQRHVLTARVGGMPAAALSAAAFDPSGTRVVTGGRDGAVRVWEVATGTELFVLSGHDGMVRSVGFSPDGGRVVTAGEDGTARIWDTRTRVAVHVLKEHAGRVSAAAYNPTGDRVVTAGEDETARVWDARTGVEIRVLKGHVGPVRAAAFAPDGARVATGGYDGTVRVWDAGTGAELLAHKGHERRVDSVPGAVFNSPARVVNAVGFGPGGDTLLTAGDDGTARVWDARVGAEGRTFRGHTGWVSAAAYSPDGAVIATGGDDTTTRLWNVSTGAVIRVLGGHTARIRGIAFAPGGGRVATTGLDGRNGVVRVWDARTGDQLATLTGHAGAVSGVVFSQDGARVATAGQDRTARVWDARTGAEIRTLAGHTKWVHGVAFSPDGAVLASGAEDGTVRLWDIATGAVVRTLRGPDGWIHTVQFDPAGRRVAAAAGDGKAVVWDAATGAELLVLKGHVGIVYEAAFSPDGSRVVTAGMDGTARVWDARTGAELLALKGHAGTVYAAVFDPTGARVLTAGMDGTARVWDATPVNREFRPTR